MHAASAIDAGTFRFATGAARFTAFGIITDGDGVIIRECALEPAVWAHDDAELFPEVAETKPEDEGKNTDETKGGGVGQRAVIDEEIKSFDRDKVG